MYMVVLFCNMWIFCWGFIGVIVSKRNLFKILISLEIIFLSCNMNFLLFSIFLDDIVGQITTMFILGVAAAEVSIGLALLILFYKSNYNIKTCNIFLIKG